jgi:hypothetical protein
MTVALLRYLTADVLRSQRWVPPVLCFLIAISVGDAGGGSALSCYGTTSAAMLAIALWLTMVVTGSEDPVQTAITVVTVGGPTRVRLAKIATAYLACLPLVLFAVGWPLLVGGHAANVSAVAAGLVAHLVTALTGVGFGALLSRQVLRHTAWAVLFGVGICVAELAIPDCPPARQLLTALGADHPHHLAAAIAVTAAQAVAIAAVTIVGAHRIARSRA